MLPLTRKELKSHKHVEKWLICEIRFFKKIFRGENYWKVKGHCHYTSKYRGSAHGIWNLKFNVLNEFLEILSLNN